MLCASIISSLVNRLLNMAWLTQKLAPPQLLIESLLTNRIHPRKRHRLFGVFYMVNFKVLRHPTSTTHTAKPLYGFALSTLIPIT